MRSDFLSKKNCVSQQLCIRGRSRRAGPRILTELNPPAERWRRGGLGPRRARATAGRTSSAGSRPTEDRVSACGKSDAGLRFCRSTFDLLAGSALSVVARALFFFGVGVPRIDRVVRCRCGRKDRRSALGGRFGACVGGAQQARLPARVPPRGRKGPTVSDRERQHQPAARVGASLAGTPAEGRALPGHRSGPCWSGAPGPLLRACRTSDSSWSFSLRTWSLTVERRHPAARDSAPSLFGDLFF